MECLKRLNSNLLIPFCIILSPHNVSRSVQELFSLLYVAMNTKWLQKKVTDLSLVRLPNDENQSGTFLRMKFSSFWLCWREWSIWYGLTHGVGLTWYFWAVRPRYEDIFTHTAAICTVVITRWLCSGQLISPGLGTL